MSNIANASAVTVSNDGSTLWRVRWSGAAQGRLDFLGANAEQDALAFALEAKEAQITRRTVQAGKDLHETVQAMSGAVKAQHERELAAIEASW